MGSNSTLRTRSLGVCIFCTCLTFTVWARGGEGPDFNNIDGIASFGTDDASESGNPAEIARSIEIILADYDDGACQVKKWRLSHKKCCHKTGKRWTRTPGCRGAWTWRNPTIRQRWYSHERFLSYGRAIIDACNEFKMNTNVCITAALEEFFRQSKFLPDAWARHNRDEHGNVITFKDEWCDKAAQRLGFRNSLELIENATPDSKADKRFRRLCEPERVARGDAGMGQQHISTLYRVGRRLYGPRFHYVQVRNPLTSIRITIAWIAGQRAWNRCGKWLAKSAGKVPRGCDRGVTCSCAKTRVCLGTPMKVGNPKSCCRHAEWIKEARRRARTQKTPGEG